MLGGPRATWPCYLQAAGFTEDTLPIQKLMLCGSSFPLAISTLRLPHNLHRNPCAFWFFLDFASYSLALTDGGRIQASWPKQRDDLCSISGFPCQALKLSSLSLILQCLVISVTKDRLFTNQEMTFARNSCHKSPFPHPSVHEPAEMSLRKSRNWIMSYLQEHSAFWGKGLHTWGYLHLPHFNLLVFLEPIKTLIPC